MDSLLIEEDDELELGEPGEKPDLKEEGKEKEETSKPETEKTDEKEDTKVEVKQKFTEIAPI